MSEQKKVLVVGVGSIGERHLRCFQKTGRVGLSLCEVNPKLRDRISSHYGIDSAFDNLEAALADSPDAVVIATPAQLHISMAMQAAEAGSHVLIEKPLSISTEGVQELIDKIAEKGLVGAVAYVLHCYPALIQARDAIRSGRFGDPVEIVVDCGQNFPTYRPAYREIYYNNHATGGGAVQDAMTHMLNAGEWLVGPIDRLVADFDHKVLEGVEVEDTVHIITRQGNVMGCYTLNQYQHKNQSDIKIVCTEGVVVIDMIDNCWRWVKEIEEPWHVEKCEPAERDDHFIAQANIFLDMVEGKTSNWNPIEDGLQTLRCNLAILKSVEENCWQTIER
ncbi:MAG: Gfo/Idh/MocA family oxidoreductase [Pirellulales bacterium]|nr:Gfo/Idh/MocA family oxidoreductase [Pirellulales bacterium]